MDVKSTCFCSNCKLSKIKPNIPMYAPYNVHLEPDKKYKWCSCGKSTTEPFCDGSSHKGTGIKPISFTTTKTQIQFSLCGCKYTRSPPFCDGYHSIMLYNPQNPPCTCTNSIINDW